MICKYLFVGTPNIYRLYLKDNRIDTIEDRAFDNLTNLVELKLGSNLLTRTPKLRHSPTLRRLCLNNNHLKTLQRNSFANVNLEQLTVSKTSYIIIQYLVTLYSGGEQEAAPFEDPLC